METGSEVDGLVSVILLIDSLFSKCRSQKQKSVIELSNLLYADIESSLDVFGRMEGIIASFDLTARIMTFIPKPSASRSGSV
ncbi:MAG: hypothetical protein Tsb009_01350 [Planctomycetaceae bacterium]